MHLKVFFLLSLLVIASGKQQKTNANKNLQELLLEYYKNADSIKHDKFRQVCPIWSKPKNFVEIEEKIDLKRFFSSSPQMLDLNSKPGPQAKINLKPNVKEIYKNKAKMIINGLLDKCKVAFVNMKKYNSAFDDPIEKMRFLDPQEFIKCMQVL